MVRVVTDRPNIVRPLYFCGNKFAVLRKVAYKQTLGSARGKVELYKSLDYEVGALRTQTRSDVINRDTTL